MQWFCFVIIAAFFSLLGWRLVRSTRNVSLGLSEHRRLRQELMLAAQMCPACGYSVRVNTDRCPECGQPLMLN